jgi:hypothetical protein
MQRKWLGIGFMVTLMVVLAIPGAWALDKGPETIDINAQVMYPELFTKKDKKHTPFAHHKHSDEYLKGNQEYNKYEYTDAYACAGCHHTSKADEQPEACFKCKDVNKMLEKVKGKHDKIYHASCRDGCHVAMADAGKKSGPTKKAWGDVKKCVGCHPKKK